MKEIAELRKEFRKHWKGWLQINEPGGIGSTFGAPDLLVLLKRTGFIPLLLPIELKCAEVEDDRIFSTAIRPAQLRWHRDYINHGGLSVFVFGTDKDGWFLAPAVAVLPFCEEGIPLPCVARIWPSNSLEQSVTRCFSTHAA